MVRPLNLPTNHEQEEPGDRNVSRVRALNIPDQFVPSTPIDKPKRLKIEDQVVSPPKQERRVKPLNVQYTPPTRAPKKKTITDTLLDKVATIDSTIDPVEIRGKIDSLLQRDLRGILDWGDRNLVPLSMASQIQAEITGRMAQINASGWLKDTMDVSCKKPVSGLSSLFSGPPPKPEYYENMLKKCRTELMSLVDQITTVYNNYLPDVHDLHLDAVSLLAVYETIEDSSDQLVASNRAKSLMTAHQTGVMLLECIKQTKLQCAKYIQQIDDLLTVTIPNWKIAVSKA